MDIIKELIGRLFFDHFVQAIYTGEQIQFYFPLQKCHHIFQRRSMLSWTCKHPEVCILFPIIPTCHINISTACSKMFPNETQSLFVNILNLPFPLFVYFCSRESLFGSLKKNHCMLVHLISCRVSLSSTFSGITKNFLLLSINQTHQKC